MATIHDVAQDAGVSPTTVSRYLNNRIELPPATAARIDAAIKKLDYRPNLLAKRLSTGKTEAVGLVTPEIREPFFAELASAFEDEADHHGYTVFMSSTRSDRKREIASLERLQDGHVDGLLMMTNTPDDGTLAGLIGERRNVVIVDEDIPGVSVPRLFVENSEGAYQATRHLIEAGHRRIAYLGGPQGLLTVTERREGFLMAMNEAGIAVRSEYVAMGSFAPELARAATVRFLELPLPPTAIFASSDYLAIGAVMGLRDANVSVPDEVSLIGFDDIAFSTLLTPPLSAVRQPVEQLGRQGFLTLLALLNGETPPLLTRLPVELIRRQSVAAPTSKDFRA
ncbi:MAG: LacI family DNA-binding transcriptional regulator [Devosia sp.]|uniref:LacI family DNA-binding transcriptional regulator n=1 Tax=Devosia sp. TaxID=1871048 RepID=UPI001ACCA234|nr:LacI family DNA-binding transcriptional regulator [Devosia sp.]MBN9315864.1 LacI family DNA-binding transcriptional regulator [Devosia sp.]